MPAGTGALSGTGSCSAVPPDPLCQVLVLGWCLFLGRGTQDSLEVEDPLAEAEKRPWDSVRDGRGGMSGREASESKGGRSVREGQWSESPGPRTHGVAGRAAEAPGEGSSLREPVP